MNNIEKYPKTEDALRAWKNSGAGTPYVDWLKDEYRELHTPTLLEAAERVNRIHREINDWEDGLEDAFCELDVAIRRKMHNPRNCEKYKTADEAWGAFTNLCDRYERCENCPVFKHREPGRDDKCFAAWLYMDANEAY